MFLTEPPQGKAGGIPQVPAEGVPVYGLFDYGFQLPDITGQSWASASMVPHPLKVRNWESVWQRSTGRQVILKKALNIMAMCRAFFMGLFSVYDHGMGHARVFVHSFLSPDKAHRHRRTVMGIGTGKLTGGTDIQGCLLCQLSFDTRANLYPVTIKLTAVNAEG